MKGVAERMLRGSGFIVHIGGGLRPGADMTGHMERNRTLSFQSTL
jgi:hypothetical protein